MGTWGDGIYDNDSALDELADLLAIAEPGDDVPALVARIGLLAWLHPVSVTHGEGVRELVAGIDARGLAELPEATQQALRSLVDDPEGATQTRSRSEAARAAIGGYSNGPRIDALLRFPGAQPAIDALGERAASALDGALDGKGDLYEVAGSLAALGVAIELAEADLFRPSAARLERWRAGFDAIDRATKDERGFWWRYVRRVRAGLDLLGPKVAPARPIVRRRAAPAKAKAKAAAPAGPEERYRHSKYGDGTLVARTGAGDSETLELRFDDGSVRRILARFVTRLTAGSD